MLTVDAEGYSPEQVMKYWVMPPDLQVGVGRSMVVVGPWGTGKTHLLRHLELENAGKAIRVSLPVIFDANRSGSPALGQQFVANDERIILAQAMLFVGMLAEVQNHDTAGSALEISVDLFDGKSPPEVLADLRLRQLQSPHIQGFNLYDSIRHLSRALSSDLLLLLFDSAERLGLEEATAIESLLTKQSPAITVLTCQPGNPYLGNCNVADSQDYDVRTTMYDVTRAGQRDQFEEVLRRREPALDELPTEIRQSVVSLANGIPRTGAALLNKATASGDVRLLVDEAIKKSAYDIPKPASRAELCNVVVRVTGVPDDFNHCEDQVRLSLPAQSAFPRFDDTWKTVNKLIRLGILTPVDLGDMRPFSVPDECWVHPGLVHYGLELKRKRSEESR